MSDYKYFINYVLKLFAWKAKDLDLANGKLNDEFENYALKLYDILVRDKTITRGRKEILPQQ